MDWNEKYKPKNQSELIGKTDEFLKLFSWLENEESKTTGAIISGNHGSGKTVLINMLMEKFNIKTTVITQNLIKTYRLTGDYEDFFNNKNTITNSIMIKNKKKMLRRAIIFDKIDNVTLSAEKKFILELFKMNLKKRAFIIIFINNNNKHSKLLKPIERLCVTINIKIPEKSDLIGFVATIAKNEGLKLTKKTAELIVDFSQNDIRRLINILQELYISYKNKKINEDAFQTFIKNSKQKNCEMGLLVAGRKIINEKLNHDEIIKLFMNQKVLLPLVIHFNFIKKAFPPCKDPKKQDELLFNLVKTTDSLSKGDNIETSIYTDQNWFLQNIHGFYSSTNTNFWINNNNHKKQVNICFGRELNITSLKNINRKNIKNLNRIIGEKDIEEILMINGLSNKMLKENKEKEFVKILKNYKEDIDMKDLTLMLKIDKSSDFVTLKKKSDLKNNLKDLLS